MGTESLTAGVFGQTADPAWRFRFLRAALCGVPPPPGTHSQALQLLDSSSYGALVCRLLPVVALTAAATEVDVILHAILRSTQAVKYFICLMSVTPELQQASMNFLLSQVFNETVLRISVQHRRCLGVTVAVSRSSDSAARTALRCLSGRALIGRPVAESTIAAELFCIITRDVLAAEDICQALYDAVFQTSSMTSCSPAPTSCVFCSNHQGRSQWLISIAAADSIAFFLEKMSELLLAQVTVVCGNDSDHAVRTAYRDINKTCTVLAGIALCASASRKGDSIIKSQITKLITSLSNIPKDPGMLRIRESVLYFRTLRCVISLLTLVALCAFEGDQSSVAVLAIAVEIHRVTSLELYQGASDGADTFLLDEMYYSFFLRSALSLMDGRALCRVALETIYVQDDFGGFISRNRDGNYSHSCKAYEHGQGPCSPDSLIGRRVDGVIELSKSRLPSSDACRKVMRELAPGTIISVENILYTVSIVDIVCSWY